MAAGSRFPKAQKAGWGYDLDRPVELIDQETGEVKEFDSCPSAGGYVRRHLLGSDALPVPDLAVAFACEAELVGTQGALAGIRFAWGKES